MDTIEHFFSCPYCGEKISMILDLSAGAARYIEDCEVCCAPIEVSYGVEGGKMEDFDARTTEE